MGHRWADKMLAELGKESFEGVGKKHRELLLVSSPGNVRGYWVTVLLWTHMRRGATNTATVFLSDTAIDLGAGRLVLPDQPVCMFTRKAWDRSVERSALYPCHLSIDLLDGDITIEILDSPSSGEDDAGP